MAIENTFFVWYCFEPPHPQYILQFCRKIPVYSGRLGALVFVWVSRDSRSEARDGVGGRGLISFFLLLSSQAFLHSVHSANCCVTNARVAQFQN